MPLFVRHARAACALVFGFALLTPAAFAQSLDMLQSLSSEQQQELLEQFQNRGQVSSPVEPFEEQDVVEPLPLNEVAPKDEKTGLRPFGYELFAGKPSTFAPATNIPVPSDYVIGPGDIINLQLYGKESGDFELRVSRDGTLFLPDLGAVTVAGLEYDDMVALIRDRITRQKIGVKANITMGELRSIRVLILGEARQPGSYTVSSLSTMTNALLVSGGIKTIGSLRKVQLKRQGKTVAKLDLYDLLLSGDTSDDERLHPGDVIFIPPVGRTVAIDGAVRRPAIYELKNENRLEQLIDMAGGLKPGAWLDRVTIERYDGEGGKTLVQSSARGQGRLAKLDDGDLVTVYAAIDRADDHVQLSGHLERSGRFAWREGLRLTDLVPDSRSLKPRADLDFALIMRYQPESARLTPLYANPRAAFEQPGGPDDPVLAPSDRIFFFAGYQQQGADFLAEGDDGDSQAGRLRSSDGDTRAESQELLAAGIDDERLASEETESSRSQVIAGLVSSLEAQADFAEPTPVARVNGAVRFPGRYPLDQRGTSVADLVRAAGGLSEHAYLSEVEITREAQEETPRGPQATIEHQIIDLSGGGLAAAGTVPLQAGDTVTVHFLPLSAQRIEVEIRGEVRFPGDYRVRRGETILDLIERAGGLTENAFAFGAMFTREDLQAREQEQVQRLSRRLRADLASVSLEQLGENQEAAKAFQTAQGLLTQLDNYEAVGRLVIDLPEMIAAGQSRVQLEDGDRLLIPSVPNEVTVVGEVQFPTSHLYRSKIGRDDYVGLSGGTTDRADEKRIYVVRANGAVFVDKGWFSPQPKIQAGDVIVVPLDATPIDALNIATSVTQIIYQIGLAVASFNAVGAF